MTPQQLTAAIGCTPANADKYCAALNAAMEKYAINTPLRQAYFLGQIAVESGHLSVVEEALSYGADRLMVVWPSRFPTMGVAMQYARQPAKLANQVYGNRMGNGAPETGDGYRYRGRGLKQLTGKDNYTAYQASSGKPVVSNPDLLLQPEAAADSAGWFWSKNGLNALADKCDVVGITKRVNGGQIGLLERTRCSEQAKKALKAV
jgi:putative chitinase